MTRTRIALLAAAASVTIVIVGVVSVLHLPSVTPSPPAPAPSAEARSLRAAARAGLDESWHRASPTDRRFFDGVWRNGGRGCLRCDVGPGVTAAALGVLDNDRKYVDLAVETMDSAIDRSQMGSGAFAMTGDDSDPDIQTCFFTAHLGLATRILGRRLDQKHRTAWTDALRGAVDYLQGNGNYEWYTNGNIALCNALAAAVTWGATGDARYETIYRRALSFAEDPPIARWPGRGLAMTKNPTRADGSDGAGYLTEAAGAARPGFDADYVQVQADFAAVIALVTGDPEAIRLTNLLVNELLPRVFKSTWLLNTSGGSRHPDQNRTVPFTTSALAILADRGRPDLAALVPSQTAAMGTYIPDDEAQGAYELWGSRLAPALMSVR
jgi:hypothetical protein